jgi:hypothetical protein
MCSVGPGEVPFTTTDSRMEHPCVMFLRETRREKSGVNDVSCVLTTAPCTAKHAQNQTTARARENMVFRRLSVHRKWSDARGAYIRSFVAFRSRKTLQDPVTVETLQTPTEFQAQRLDARCLSFAVWSKRVRGPVVSPICATASPEPRDFGNWRPRGF